MPKPIPSRLKRYVAKQTYAKYTEEDHALWRFIMMHLTSFLSKNGHPAYNKGLKKTGISLDRIPQIKDIDKKLRKFGWGAIPVSGFIPPAAFMEFQALGYLPIASEIRTVEHINYTPAPDIVHEAAGHAPILIDKAFAAYLRQYAEVARKAIISKEDLDIYGCIRSLSDAKENPNSTEDEIQKLENKLEAAVKAAKNVSEATLLSRMNWWTAEYGLIGSLQKPKIYGAGLLSSLGEAKDCLKPHVKKLPMSIKCVEYTYDITEPQPQLFVTPSFKALETSLERLAKSMSFRRGGLYGVQKAIEAKSVNTVELNTGLQLSGKLVDCMEDGNKPYFVRFTGPTQVCYKGKELPNQGTKYHKEGYSTPLGKYKISKKLKVGESLEFRYASGILLAGKVKKIINRAGAPVLVQFTNCTVTLGDQVLYQPEWGPFDLALAHTVSSVFGGPADIEKYGRTESFDAPRIPKKVYTEDQKQLFQSIKVSYKLAHLKKPTKKSLSDLKHNCQLYFERWPKHWLLGLQLYEAGRNIDLDIATDLRAHLLSKSEKQYHKLIEESFDLIDLA